MAYKEMFFVQVFEFDGKKRLIAGRSYPVTSEEEAKRKASWLSDKVPGVVAFRQMVDEEAADAEEPVLLIFYGRVPPEVRAAA
jgi:hypothetical protein